MARQAENLASLTALLRAIRRAQGVWSVLVYLPRQVYWKLRSRLHIKFIVVIVTLQVVTMGTVTVVTDHHQRQAILEQTRLRALALARSLAIQSEGYLLSYNFFKLEQLVEDVTADDPDVIYAVIHLRDGVVAAFSGQDESQGQQLTDPISQRALQAREPLIQSIVLPQVSEPGYDVAIPVFVEHSRGKWGTIRLGFSLQQAYERVAQTRRSLYILSLGAIVCGTFLAIVLARRVSRPIRLLVQGAQAFARGAYGHAIRVETHDELAYLARTFEQMMQAIMRDVSERQRLEAHLQQAQKMEAIGTLAGGIAHDFNNVLAIMMGYTQVALHGEPADRSKRQALQEVLTAGNRAKDMVQQILRFSRQHEQERQRLSLHLIAQEVVRFLRVSLPSTIEIRQDLSKDAGMVLADPTQLHQVLMNLSVNAEHAMRDTGGILEIRIDSVAADDAAVQAHPALEAKPHVRLCVRDTGCGIPPEVVEKIFDPFFTTKPIGEGTGMGLAMVHGIVNRHGGVIAVESQPGAGTTFTIYLPQVEEVVKAEPSAPTPSTHRAGCLLWVDDEAAITHLSQNLLQRHGYDVVAHTRSDTALRAFYTNPNRFDLVITDQTMPYMTGERMVRELRRIRPDIPIILCTGFSHVMSAEKAQALGIDAFLMKPTPAGDWVATIEQVLDAYERRHRGFLTAPQSLKTETRS